MDSQRDARAALEEYRLHGWREVGPELGRGSYAAVVEVDYKGLKCAAKKIHRVLYEQGIGNLVSRFEQECRLLSQLRHPHVVQFLGIYFDPDSDLPVLVMEFLPTTLAQCLDIYGVLPEEINYGILRDVAVGLRYLHERPQPIVHRDLSANNVLLTRDMRGKISDLGVAKILGLSAAQRMTQGPGTAPYMPPEALVPNPRYDVKVDIFSFGVMMVHILCGRWPFPGEPVRANPDNPDDLTPISEVGRRQEFLDDIPQDHPLMELIHRCLRNSPAHRPDASSVAERVSEVSLQSPPSFNNKVEMMDRIRMDAEQRERLQRDIEMLTQERDAAVSQQKANSLEVEDLQLEVADLAADVARSRESIAHRDAALTDKDRVHLLAVLQMEQAHEQAFERQDEIHKQSLKRQHEAQARNDQAHQQALQLKDEELAQKDRSHQQALQQKERAHQQALQLKEEEVTHMNQAHTQAVEGIKGAHQEAMALKDQSHQTELLARQTELTLLRQELTSSRDSASQKQEMISHLRDQLRRCRAHLASNQQVNLVTTSGAKLVWRQCAELPIALRGAQAVVINGIVYVGGGGCISDTERCTVCRYHPGEDKWATLPPSPVKWFGIGQVSGQLVLVGGWVVSTNKVTGDVHVFTSESQQWEKSIPAMSTARRMPSVVTTSTVLVACGGGDQSKMPLSTVELYSIEASQWYQCPPLPSPRCWISSVLVAIEDTAFLVGGCTTASPNSETKSVFSASLSTLIDRAIHHTTGSARTQQLWTTLKDVPYHLPAPASIGGCLLALGGKDCDRAWTGQVLRSLGGITGRPQQYDPVSASIHTYLPTSSTWHQTGELPLPLYRSTAVLLPTNELLIIGGMNKDDRTMKNVYKGSVAFTCSTCL